MENQPRPDRIPESTDPVQGELPGIVWQDDDVAPDPVGCNNPKRRWYDKEESTLFAEGTPE